MSTIKARFPNCGVLIVGDFNRLDICRFMNAFHLKHVNFFTRGYRTIDLMPANMKDYFKEPIKRPTFGLSDHRACINPKPAVLDQKPETVYTIKGLASYRKDRYEFIS